MFGQDYSDKYKKIIDELDIMNLKWQDYFDSRKCKMAPEEKDCLAFHYWMVNQYGTITFGFLPDSDIDQSIKTKCLGLFDRMFHEKSDKNNN